ncbi:MAG TPA: alanine racemase [Pyrinomonadaceae bacterium]|jgi:D-serine deaminase-like pyridoxal phosphate-dependent protein|nr:alanine racemase [Pyrinomonadaceae bacterium]
MHISELETPAVIVDLDVMERNLSRMADYCRTHQLLLRPHTKSHKVPELAKRQIASGATGITVAKVGEAEVMLAAGIDDMLIAYPIVGADKTARLARIAERAQVSVSLDSEEAAREISAAAARQGTTIGILVEMDVGFRRCGLSNENDLVTLAQKITELPALEFKGLMFFPGHFGVGPEQRATLRAQVNEFLEASIAAFERAGVPLSVVSGGSTPTAYESGLFRGVNEVRPGMYIFNDRNTVAISACSLSDCALSVAVTVVSTAVSGHAIIDGGSKTFSYDRFQGGDGSGFGIVKEDSAAEVERFSEEHGHLNIAHSERRYRVGERLSIIPNHVCTTVNMHDEIYGVRGEQVEEVWRVAARGKVR